MSSSINIKSNRIETFDIAKGLGILIMVMGHTGFGTTFDKLIHTFHMPLFFFISGYFYRPDKSRNFKTYLIHQVNVLIVPYVVFVLFYQILHYVYTGEWTAEYFIKSMFSSNHNRIDVAGAMWFLLCLFSAKVTYYLIDHSIIRLWEKTLGITVISLLSLTFRRFDIMLPLCLDSAFSMLIVIHFGYLLYVFRSRNLIQRLSQLSPVIIILLIAVFVITGLYNNHVNIRRNKYGVEVLYMVSCFIGILLTMNISQLLSRPGNKILNKIKKIFAFWGRESIVFLLVNELFLFIVSELFIVIGVSYQLVTSNYCMRVLIMLGAMGLMSVVALFSPKPPLNYLFGKKSLSKGKKNSV